MFLHTHKEVHVEHLLDGQEESVRVHKIQLLNHYICKGSLVVLCSWFNCWLSPIAHWLHSNIILPVHPPKHHGNCSVKTESMISCQQWKHLNIWVWTTMKLWSSSAAHHDPTLRLLHVASPGLISFLIQSVPWRIQVWGEKLALLAYLLQRNELLMFGMFRGQLWGQHVFFQRDDDSECNSNLAWDPPTPTNCSTSFNIYQKCKN